mgnify:FL=1
MGDGVGIRPVRLTCEYRENPVGIDVVQPRLSWVVESDERGQRQTAYRVLVASTAELLATDRSDLWDSGRVASSETIQIAYGGGGLEPGRTCWWKVRVWDGGGRASLWSEPASWTMGLFLDGLAEGARWIGAVPDRAAMADNPDRLECPPESWRQWKAGLAESGEQPEPRLLTPELVVRESA